MSCLESHRYLRARSQVTTSCTVDLTSGNFGFVRIPMLLLFILMKPLLWSDDESRLKGGGFYRDDSLAVNRTET